MKKGCQETTTSFSSAGDVSIVKCTCGQWPTGIPGSYGSTGVKEGPDLIAKPYGENGRRGRRGEAWGIRVKIVRL